MNKSLLSFLFFVNSTVSLPLFALDTDARQPISIESNSGFYDDKKGVSIYTGDVVVKQGSLRLDADKLVVYLENREVQKMIATGEPVKFKQKPAEGAEDVRGESLIAEYYPETEVLILMKKAVISQKGNSTASERIVYDRLGEVLTAGDGASASKRVVVVLQPKNSTGQ